MMTFRSIRIHILTAVLCALTLSSGITALLNYRDTKEQVEEVFDAELAQMARVLQSIFASQLPSDSRPLNPLIYEDFQLDGLSTNEAGDDEEDHEVSQFGHKYEKKLAFQVWLPDGQLMLQSRSAADHGIPPYAQGFHSIQLGATQWRLFSISDPKGYWIQVAQRLEVRSELTNEIAEHSMQAPLFIALLLAGAIWLIIGKAFRPLQTISQAVAERHIGHLSPIDIANTPTEVQALILAINRLLARVKEQALSERRFTADAAHELRTPLAAMKIQLQNGLRRIEGGKAAHSLNQSLKALDRMTHLVEQLLLLSRLDASEVIDTPDIVVLSQTVQDVLDEYQHVINARNIRVQVEESSHPEVTAHSALIHTLIKNFIDNALRYTPDSELLRIKIEKNILIIEDSGPGIPLEQQSKVFSRFYRVEGDHSKGEGLGLAICEKIADLYGYRIQLENIPPPGSGLRVLLFFSPVFK